MQPEQKNTVDVRVRRALLAISVLAFLAFGSHAALTIIAMPGEEPEPLQDATSGLKQLEEYAAREAERMDQAGVLSQHTPEEYANALATAARTGVAPKWAHEYGKQLEKRRKTDPATIDELIRHSPTTSYASRSLAVEKTRFSLALAVGIPALLWSLFFLSRWIWTGHFRGHGAEQTEKPGS